MPEPEVGPTIAAVCSPSYWQPAPPLYDFTRRFRIPRLFEVATAHTPGGPHPRKVGDTVHNQARGLLSEVALQLLDGTPAIQGLRQGEPLGTPDDTRYFVPGHVLLVDTEEIYISPDGPFEPPRHVIEEDSEVAMDALELFRGAVRRITPDNQESYREWWPYEGGITWTRDGRMHEYSRKVDLFAVCRAKDGRVTTLGLNYLTIAANNAATADVPRGNFDSKVGGHRRSLWPAARIGQIINRTADRKRTNLLRLRSAALCLRGSL